MRKLLLLDADVVIDLHSLGLFGKTRKAYDICLTRNVFEEARYYKKSGAKIGIDIKAVIIIDDVDLESLRKVKREAKEARLGIDPGESTSIAYLCQTKEEITFCSCDQAAIKLISYMELEQRSISLEKALRSAGYHGKKLYPRHLERPSSQPLMKEKHLEFNSKNLCSFDIKVMPQIVISWGNKSLVREGNSVGTPFAPLMLVFGVSTI